MTASTSPAERQHLAILTLDFAPQIGGVQTYLYEIARRLTPMYDVSIITPVEGTLCSDAGLRKVRPIPKNALGVWRALSALQPDHVLVGHSHPQLLIPAALHTRIQYSAVAYGNDYLAAQQRWHHFIFNWLLRQSAPLITITHANARRLYQLGLPKPVVVYPGTDPTRFTPKPDATSTSLTLLTVGRLVPRKGVDTVLRALPMLLDALPNLRYQIAGDGPDRPRLEQLAQDLGVAHAVTFLGYVADEALPKIYRQADVFVMPAREERQATSIEGFGIVYLEAGASGLPVVAGRSGGAVEAIRDGETGYLVDPRDTDTLAITLLELLHNPELRQQMGHAGRRWVEQEMNWDRAARQMEEALQLR